MVPVWSCSCCAEEPFSLVWGSDREIECGDMLHVRLTLEVLNIAPQLQLLMHYRAESKKCSWVCTPRGWKLGIDQSAKFRKLHQQQYWFCCWRLCCKCWEPRTDCGERQEEHHHHHHLTPSVIVVAVFYDKCFLATKHTATKLSHVRVVEQNNQLSAWEQKSRKDTSIRSQ